MEKVLKDLGNQGYQVANLEILGGRNSYLVFNNRVGLFATILGGKAIGCAVPAQSVDFFLQKLSKDMAGKLQTLGAWAVENCQCISGDAPEYLSGIFSVEDILDWGFRNAVCVAAC